MEVTMPADSTSKHRTVGLQEEAVALLPSAPGERTWMTKTNAPSLTFHNWESEALCHYSTCPTLLWFTV